MPKTFPKTVSKVIKTVQKSKILRKVSKVKKTQKTFCFESKVTSSFIILFPARPPLKELLLKTFLPCHKLLLPSSLPLETPSKT